MGNDQADLKHLSVRRDRLDHELALLRSELSGLDQKIRAATREQSGIDAQIRKLKESTKIKPVIVSEHALLRYLERVKGVDIEALKKEIAPEHILGRVRAMGNGEYPVGGTHTLKVQDSTIVTVLTKEEKPIPKEREPKTPAVVTPPLIEIKKPVGALQCLRCKDGVDRLLKGDICEVCTQEEIMGEQDA